MSHNDGMPKNNKSVQNQFDYAKCTGCSACIQCCSVNAIAMNTNDKGFLYPNFKENCINCGKCVTVCPELNIYDDKVIEINEYFCATLKNKLKLDYSASGGAFVALSDVILSKGGVVIGAVLTDDLQIVHYIAYNTEERNRICGSKYVQSNMSDIFVTVKKLLLNGKIVMFTGTPCQIAGLKNYIVKNLTEKLITIDILCHGVPNQDVFNSYISSLENKYGVVKYYNFRDRTFGMHGSNVHIRFDNGFELANTLECNSFDKLYGKGYLMRESCYNCKYASLNRLGDITIGDFWGIEKVDPNWDTGNGASLVIINSYKGKTLWDDASHYMEWFATSQSSCLQESLIKPISKPDDYALFWNKYKKCGYATCANLFAGSNTISKYYMLYRKIRRKLCSIMKKISLLVRKGE